MMEMMGNYPNNMAELFSLVFLFLLIYEPSIFHGVFMRSGLGQHIKSCVYTLGLYQLNTLDKTGPTVPSALRHMNTKRRTATLKISI